MANASYPKEIRDDLRLLPSKEMVGLLSFDHRGAAADYLFTQVSIHSGSLMWKPLDIKFDSGWAYGMMDLVTDLDPKYREAYLMSGMGLIHNFSDVNLAPPILKKGMEANPDSWEIPYWYGYDHYFYLDDSDTAAIYFTEAARKPGAPKTNWGILVNVAREAGHYEKAYWALQVMYDSAKSEKIKNIYAKKLVQLQNIFLIQKAADAYQQEKGAYPAALGEIIEKGYMEEIPEDPMGKGYTWDVEKKKVVIKE
jgi:tetratricopeptide (TPR) repeat protein